jgi:hypothetical protein
MTKIFALLAVLLILTGAIVLVGPRLDQAVAPETRGAAPVEYMPTLFSRVRDIAEQVNAPLSILFGLVSLYYSRRNYLRQRDGG